MRSSSKVVVAGVPALVLAIGLPFTEHWEGLRTSPYQDIIGKWTVCIGETNVEMRKYSEAECRQMFGESWAKYYVAMVKCYPELKSAPASVQAMVTDLGYNNGTGAVCSAKNMGSAIRSGKWASVCQNLKSWVRAGGAVSKGLQNRRYVADYNSYDVCMSGVK